jgi:hypothetical protein
MLFALCKLFQRYGWGVSHIVAISKLVRIREPLVTPESNLLVLTLSEKSHANSKILNGYLLPRHPDENPKET